MGRGALVRGSVPHVRYGECPVEGIRGEVTNVQLLVLCD